MVIKTFCSAKVIKLYYFILKGCFTIKGCQENKKNPSFKMSMIFLWRKSKRL